MMWSIIHCEYFLFMRFKSSLYDQMMIDYEKESAEINLKQVKLRSMSNQSEEIKCNLYYMSCLIEVRTSMSPDSSYKFYY